MAEVKDIIQDAYHLYEKAIDELERGNIREAAEKAWGATARATGALILGMSGEKLEGTIGMTKKLHELAEMNKRVSELLIGRYHTRESFLHGHCFYMGILEPRGEIERRIRETKLYIDDIKQIIY